MLVMLCKHLFEVHSLASTVCTKRLKVAVVEVVSLAGQRSIAVVNEHTVVEIGDALLASCDGAVDVWTVQLESPPRLVDKLHAKVRRVWTCPCDVTCALVVSCQVSELKIKVE